MPEEREPFRVVCDQRLLAWSSSAKRLCRLLRFEPFVVCCVSDEDDSTPIQDRSKLQPGFSFYNGVGVSLGFPPVLALGSRAQVRKPEL